MKNGHAQEMVWLFLAVVLLFLRPVYSNNEIMLRLVA
jgi:hypothetical protein